MGAGVLNARIPEPTGLLRDHSSSHWDLRRNGSLGQLGQLGQLAEQISLPVTERTLPGPLGGFLLQFLLSAMLHGTL